MMDFINGAIKDLKELTKTLIEVFPAICVLMLPALLLLAAIS